MKVLGHGVDKYPVGRLLESSVERSWAGLFAERRSHPAGELPSFTPTYTEVANPGAQSVHSDSAGRRCLSANGRHARDDLAVPSRPEGGFPGPI